MSNHDPAALGPGRALGVGESAVLAAQDHAGVQCDGDRQEHQQDDPPAPGQEGHDLPAPGAERAGDDEDSQEEHDRHRRNQPTDGLVPPHRSALGGGKRGRVPLGVVGDTEGEGDLHNEQADAQTPPQDGSARPRVRLLHNIHGPRAPESAETERQPMGTGVTRPIPKVRRGAPRATHHQILTSGTR